MAIVKMRRLRLIAVKSQREELIRELMLMGCVEISQPENRPEDDELTGILSKESAGWLERKGELGSIIHGIELLDKYAPKKAGLLTPRPMIEREKILDDSTLELALALAGELDDKDARIKKIDSEISHSHSLSESLAPWKTLDVPLDTQETKTCSIQTGTLPESCRIRDVEDELEQADCPAAIYEVSADDDARYVLTVMLKDRQAESLEILRKSGFSSVSVSELTGTADENIRRLAERCAVLEKGREQLTEEIRREADRRWDLKLCADRLMTKSEQAENTERFLYTQSAFTFEGWIPAAKVKELEALLSAYDCAWETREPTSEETPEVPVKLNNGPLARPFNMVTEMYSLPAYNGVNPNALLFLTFTLFFGIMFADIGYGLILLAAGLIIKFKVRPRATMGYMGGMAIICGISCIVFGVITGTFFGDIIPQVAAFYGLPPTELPSLIDPLKDPMTVLIICIGIGVVHMLLGVTVNGYMLVRDGQWIDALCDTGTVYLVFAGVALGALGITWYVLYAGVAAVILTQGRESPTIAGKIGGGLWGLYNFVTGWFGDILSYSRLMALMLAGSVIAQVFNTLGAMTGSIIPFFLIFLAGHALNMGLNIIGTYVHTSRLEYLEFFGKFYREGGRPFQPMEMKTSYYDVIVNK